MPLDWNKINEDDSSISGCDSTHLYQNLKSNIIQAIQIISQPEKKINQLKSKASFNDITDLNLQKLTAIDGEQVWLFVPKPFKADHSEETYQAIKQLKNVKKVHQNIGGWNVLIGSKQEAKRLIQSGYKKNKTFLKFYISTKNQESLQTESLSRKNSNVSDYNESNNITFETPRNQRRSTFEDQKSKKKVRYAEKKIETKTIEEKNIIQEKGEEKSHAKNIESDVNIYNKQGGGEKQYKQQTEETNTCEDQYIQTRNRKNEENKTKRYKPKKQGSTLQSVGQTIKNLDKNQNDISKINFQSIKINQRQISQLQERQQLSQESKDKDQMKQPDQPQNDQDYDSEQSLERMKKAIKRKNKKLNKKKDNGSPQADSIYASNPFSILVKY